MNRVFYLIPIFFFFATGLAAQSKKQIKELKIKSATETVTIYKDGKEASTYKSDYSTFDKEGNTISQTEYNPDGSVKRKESTKYAGKNKVEEIIEHPSNAADDNSTQKKYKKITWKYNANGDKIEEAEFDAAGNLTKKTTYAYNSKGDKLFEVEYDAAGKLTKKTAYGYDNKGLRTEKKVYSPGDLLEKSVKYTYTY